MLVNNCNLKVAQTPQESCFSVFCFDRRRDDFEIVGRFKDCSAAHAYADFMRIRGGTFCHMTARACCQLSGNTARRHFLPIVCLFCHVKRSFDHVKKHELRAALIAVCSACFPVYAAMRLPFCPIFSDRSGDLVSGVLPFCYRLACARWLSFPN